MLMRRLLLDWRCPWVAVLAWAFGAVLVVMMDLGPGVSAQRFGSTHTPDALQAYGFPPSVPDPHGQFTVRGDFAAHEWHPGTDVPSRPDSLAQKRWPIIAEYVPNAPLFVYYWDGSFRSSNGSRWGTPSRWAYFRGAPEVWNPATGRMEVPGVPGSPASAPPPVSDPSKPLPKSLRYGVDSLKIRYTTGDILRAIDESPFNEPSEGAPEEGGAAPL